MACILNASTTSGFVHGADTSGVIALQNNGTTYATGNQYGIGLGTAVPTSGIGIAFPATQSASSDANTLDDYEEGTWTPTFTSLTVNSGTPVWSGTYTKVGRLVTVTFFSSGTYNITITAGSTAINNLPFGQILNAPSFGVFGNYSSSTSTGGLQGIGTTGDLRLFFTTTYSSAGNIFAGTFTYITAT